MPPKTSAEELRAEVREYASKIGGTPTLSGFAREYNRSEKTIYKYFDSWNGLIRSLDLEPNFEFHDRSSLIEKLQQHTEDLGRVPKVNEFTDRYGITHKVVSRFFDSWYNFVESAGLDTSEVYGRGANDDRLIEHLHELYEEYDRVPSSSLMAEEGLFDPATYARRFGSWIQALNIAGYDWEPLAGVDHPRWVNEPQQPNRYHPAYYQNRQRALERDGYECWHCGMSRTEHYEQYGHDLETHHILPDWLTEGDDGTIHAENNLITLCHYHHRKLYDGLFVDPRKIVERYADRR